MVKLNRERWVKSALQKDKSLQLHKTYTYSI
jgi:hypothetical protein